MKISWGSGHKPVVGVTYMMGCGTERVKGGIPLHISFDLGKTHKSLVSLMHHQEAILG
jgi:hypothetical protein